jgi:hypothetical protein
MRRRNYIVAVAAAALEITIGPLLYSIILFSLEIIIRLLIYLFIYLFIYAFTCPSMRNKMKTNSSLLLFSIFIVIVIVVLFLAN